MIRVLVPRGFSGLRQRTRCTPGGDEHAAIYAPLLSTDPEIPGRGPGIRNDLDFVPVAREQVMSFTFAALIVNELVHLVVGFHDKHRVEPVESVFPASENSEFRAFHVDFHPVQA